MRLSRIVVRNFQAIENAEIDLGPGLNVLYGPNDLGKSTLACAVRAALLVPPGAAEAADFAPWHADATPFVALTFLDDQAQYWRIRKMFGSGSTASAELHQSKDGASFSLDCKAREVEERVRALLGWGIPGPGGKNAPRRLPDSFLAHVLLAAQTDVDTILSRSVAEDLADSGKLRLTKALSALAQDPLFKKVLATAQSEVDRYFAPKGGRKRGQSSPFTQAANAVKRLADPLEALKKQVEDSKAIEGTVVNLRARHVAAQELLADAEATLATMRARFVRTQERMRAESLVAEAKTALAEIEKRAAAIAKDEQALVSASERVKLEEEGAARASEEVAAAQAALRAGEEAERVATSEQGERERELRRAQLGRENAELGEKLADVQKRRDVAAAAVAASSAATTARKILDAATRDEAAAVRGSIAAKEKLVEAEQELDLARSIVAYGRWRTAADAVTQSKEAAKLAAVDREAAEAKGRAADEKTTEATKREEEIVTRTALLPDRAALKALEAIARDLEIAEAALGGGLSIALRGSGRVAVRATVDGAESLPETNLEGRRVLEAERSASLAIGDLLEIDVVAGSAENRARLDELRRRWTAEGAPVLGRAQVSSLEQLRVELAAVEGLGAAVKELRNAIAQLRAEAAALRERATMQETRASELTARAADVDAREAAIGPHDRQTLARAFETLGKTWETQAEALQTQRTTAVTSRSEDVGKAERAREIAQLRTRDAEAQSSKADAEAEGARSQIPGGAGVDPTTVVAEAEIEIAGIHARRGAIQTEAKTVDAEATNAAAQARSAREAAAQRVERARTTEKATLASRDVARADFHSSSGQLEAKTKELAGFDRVGATARVESSVVQLATFANDVPATQADVDTAESRANTAKDGAKESLRELHQAEGALTKVGGAAVREDLARLEEALLGARQRERFLEEDADAWQLLRETLREVENDEGAHLGRALAVPVAARFSELTAGRYAGLRLDAQLRAESVDVVGASTGAEVLKALSVGTREQLATLIRLTIAEQLESAIILDDHLVQTDKERLAWFRGTLRRVAAKTQVVVLTCRPEDYVPQDEMPGETPMRELAGGAMRAIDLERLIRGRGRAGAGPVGPSAGVEP